MSSIIEAGALIDDTTPFGAYPLPVLVQFCLKITHNLPAFSLCRRLGFGLRKLVFWNTPKISDAKVGSLALRFYPKDNVTERQFLFIPQFVDRCEHDFIKAHLPPKGTFVDLGANIGMYTLWALEILEREGYLLACEPHPAMRRRLLCNLSLNSKKARFTVIPHAVSDTFGKARLHFHLQNWGESSLIRHKESSLFIEVKTKPLLHIIQKAELTQIDILKADIEGAENRALLPFFKKAPQTLWPRHLIIENSQDQVKQNLFSALKNFGYVQHHINRKNVIWSL